MGRTATLVAFALDATNEIVIPDVELREVCESLSGNRSWHYATAEI
jgi:hypothetical protein